MIAMQGKMDVDFIKGMKKQGMSNCFLLPPNYIMRFAKKNLNTIKKKKNMAD